MNNTTIIQKYKTLKTQLPTNSILLVRLGDFYETFEEDAKEVASLLQVALTKRNKIPMAGLPCHRENQWKPQLLKAGKILALVEFQT